MKNVYFLGIGGIGMSAIARHYKALGYNVAGYDRTPSSITDAMSAEGIDIVFTDSEEQIDVAFRNPDDTMVVRTPAVPADSVILSFFDRNGFRIVKRSVALGYLTSPFQTLCVAGSHGKTTTSTLTAHILREASVGCSAFLGGISVNHNTNFWSNSQSQYVVTEADEFDRSFLQLRPQMAVITGMDADHLDIYGTHAEVIKAFLQFAALVRPGGALFVKQGLPIGSQDVAEKVTVATYSLTDTAADYHAAKVRVESGRYKFDIITPSGVVADVVLGLPGLHNVENCIAAAAMALRAGVSADELRAATLSFRGNKRRFEILVNEPSAMVIDDYAHHPQEIATTIRSIRMLYPRRKLTVAFQPHLYSRTRDLADEFAQSLSMADRTWLIDIYPAREKPIEGVSSAMLLSRMAEGVGVLSTKETLPDDIVSEPFDIVVVMGAGDIDRLVPAIADKVKRTRNI